MPDWRTDPGRFFEVKKGRLMCVIFFFNSFYKRKGLNWNSYSGDFFLLSFSPFVVSSHVILYFPSLPSYKVKYF